jgi:hypothetical protein
MYILFLIAFSLVYKVLFTPINASNRFRLNATPAYVPKNKLRKKHKIPLVDFIPNFFY